VSQPHSPICVLMIPLTAVHGDLVPSLGQPYGNLFGERFETTVISRNTARTKQSDAHPPKEQPP
jgi:hypothetical protein